MQPESGTRTDLKEQGSEDDGNLSNNVREVVVGQATKETGNNVPTFSREAAKRIADIIRVSSRETTASESGNSAAGDWLVHPSKRGDG